MSKQQSSQEINDIYNLYARAIDEKRYGLLGTIFSEGAKLHYIVGREEFNCSGAESASYFKAFLDLCYWTNHLIGGASVEIRGSYAFSTARVQAVHQQILEDGSVSRWLIRGSYHDHLESIDGKWIIINRYCHTPDEEGTFLSKGVKRFPELGWTTDDKISFSKL